VSFLSNFFPDVSKARANLLTAATFAWEGRVWPCAEAAYQYAKCRVILPEYAVEILAQMDSGELRTASEFKAAGSMAAFATWGKRVHAFPTLAAANTHWRARQPALHACSEELMIEVLRAKFSVSQMRAALLATGDAALHELSGRATHWSTNASGKGGDALGRLLMAVRAEMAS